METPTPDPTPNVDDIRRSAVEIAGGEVEHQALRLFAQQNLRGKDAAFDAVNRRVETDPSAYPNMIRYVKTQHALAQADKAQPTPSTEGFRSNAEAVAMRRDQRMKFDPQFRAEYKARLAATSQDVFMVAAPMEKLPGEK